MRVAFLIILAFRFITLNVSAKETSQNTSFPEKQYGTSVLSWNVELTAFLEKHFGDFQIPPLKEFAIDMLNFYYKNHPHKAHPADNRQACGSEDW